MSLKEFSAASGNAIADDQVETLTLDTMAKRASEMFAMMPIGLIVASLTNPRTTFNQARLDELAWSIRESGVHQPVLVRPLPPSRMHDTFNNRGDGQPLPTHEIVSGERRFRASKEAGMPTIPAMIRQLTDAQVLEIQIIENLQRDDLTELEEAEGYQRLCEATGIAKEEVGKRIGKSRTYVYGRMKLLDLSTGPREALRAGTIDGSKALLIARIPDDALQLKALKAAEETDHQGSPRLSYRALQSWVQLNVMLKLSDAKFPTQDFLLVPIAGACGSCPKRTGANPDLFTDVDSPDVCTDPVCFHGKEAAHIENIVGEAQAGGMRVIEGVEAKELKTNQYSSFISGFEVLDSDMRDALTERDLKGNVVLFVDPYGKGAIEVVSDALARKARGKVAVNQPVTKETKAQKVRDELHAAHKLAMEYQTRWRTRAIDIITPRILADEITSMSANVLRRVLLELSCADVRVSDGDIKLVMPIHWATANFEDMVRAGVKSLDDTHVGRTVLLLLLQGDIKAAYFYESGAQVIDPTAPVIDELAGLLGINVDAIKAEVQAEIRAERAAESSAPNALAARPEESAKGGEKVKKSPKPAARAAKSKPTTEEAQASIAIALQGLPPEPDGVLVVDETVPSVQASEPTIQTPAITTAAAAATDAIAVAPVEIMAGDRVQFVSGLKDTKGHTAKWSGKEGTVIAVGSDALYHVRYGKRDAESVHVELWDLEPPPKPVGSMVGGAQS